jgi:GNAT superfamily N-acetyltransferase
MLRCEEGMGAMSVLHFRKVLSELPAPLEVAGISVRTMQLPEDVAAWLELRRRAVAWLKPTARAWTEADFRAEMSGKAWWRDEWTWLSVAGDGGDANEKRIVGSVTLAMREGAAESVPVVHWLLVDPRSRRRGIARLLMVHLEQAAWNAGWRGVQLETHANWSEAVAFYQSIGFSPLR